MAGGWSVPGPVRASTSWHEPYRHAVSAREDQRPGRRVIPEGMISYKGDDGAWLNVAGSRPGCGSVSAHSPGTDAAMTSSAVSSHVPLSGVYGM